MDAGLKVRLGFSVIHAPPGFSCKPYTKGPRLHLLDAIADTEIFLPCAALLYQG